MINRITFKPGEVVVMEGRPDAQGMRHAASQIRSKADRIAVVMSRLDTQVASMTFAGPAADQFRAAMAVEQSRLKQTASVLSQVADLLNQGAATVEADPTGFYQSGGRV